MNITAACKAIFTPKSYRLERLRADYVRAKERYDDALDRGDTRDQRRFWEPMRAAREAQLAAERALKLEVRGRA